MPGIRIPDAFFYVLLFYLNPLKNQWDISAKVQGTRQM